MRSRDLSPADGELGGSIGSAGRAAQVASGSARPRRGSSVRPRRGTPRRSGSPTPAPAVRPRGRSPARSMPAACIGLLDDRGKIGSSTGHRAHGRRTVGASSTATEPWCRHSTKPERTTSATTGFMAGAAFSDCTRAPSAAPHAQAATGLASGDIGGRWASLARVAARSTSCALSVPADPWRTSACPPCRPAGGRRLDSAASATGRVVRPMPVADQTSPRPAVPATAATSASARARHPAGHAHDEVAVHVAAVRQAVACPAAGAARRRGRGRTARTPGTISRSWVSW